MKLPDSLVQKLLVKSGRFDDAQIDDLIKQNTNNQPLQDLVIKNELLSELQLTRLYAEEINVPFIELKLGRINQQLLDLLPERIARQYKVIVFNRNKDQIIEIAMVDPTNSELLNYLHKSLGPNIKVYLATEHQINIALDKYHSPDELKVVEKEKLNVITDTLDLSEDSDAAKTVNLLIEKAVSLGASDIHIEPREDFIVIRYRIDGHLKDAHKLPHASLFAITGWIKQLASLNLDQHLRPQDGQFKLKVSGTNYSFRVSTMPVVDGEQIVIRILNQSIDAPSFSELGLWGKALSELNQAIVQPHGLILINGPAASGKSTTMFSILSHLNIPGNNISTIEDPIDYLMIGVNQTQVNIDSDLTFIHGLRSLLKQEPSIVMVSETRDKETADLVVEAASTGHLVFSSLHVPSAVAGLVRLKDLGIEPLQIASTLRLIVAERLVRRLCVSCRIEATPSSSEINQIRQEFGLLAEGSLSYLHDLEQTAVREGLGTDKNSENDLSTTDSSIVRLWQANPDGCSDCNNSGYKGRIGVFEVLPMTEKLSTMVANNNSSKEIAEAMFKDRLVPMRLDGLVKALRGQTTIAELLTI